MISLISYLLTFMDILFWVFRAIATLMFQLDRDFFTQPLEVNLEIALLFATLPCLIGIVKRNRAFAAIYFALYASYFGTALYNVYINCTETGFNIVNSSDLLCTFFGVLLPFLTFLDVFFNKNRGLGHGAHREDGFYANEKYDRKFDERADRNQYRT